jgi:hypothetical protein
MNLPVFPGGPIEAAIAACSGALLFALSYWAVRRAFARRAVRATAAILPSGPHPWIDEVRAVNATLLSLAARFDRLEAALSLDGRLAGSRALQRPSEAAGYELGVRLARAGAQLDELTAACGMRPEEAALLLRLHARAA